MTSFCATNIVRENNMPPFKVYGQIYHHAVSIPSLPEADSKFLQIYFMENTDEQIYQRFLFNTDIIWEIVAVLQTLFDQHNEWIQTSVVYGAMTINKARDNRYKCADQIWKIHASHMACSRVGKPFVFFLYSIEGKTKNIVYPKVL